MGTPATLPAAHMDGLPLRKVNLIVNFPDNLSCSGCSKVTSIVAFARYRPVASKTSFRNLTCVCDPHRFQVPNPSLALPTSTREQGLHVPVQLGVGFLKASSTTKRNELGK